MNLSAEDRGFIAAMRQHGVLQDEDPKRIDTSNGVMLVCCSDGDQLLDLLDHTCELFRATDDHPRPHMFAHHGGAMLLSPRNEAYTDHDPRGLLIAQLKDARPMKEINTIVLTVHAPCGCAASTGENVVELIHHMMLAKQAIKSGSIRALRDMKVACALHVDYGDGRKRTYHIRAADWFTEAGYYERYQRDTLGMGDRQHDESEPPVLHVDDDQPLRDAPRAARLAARHHAAG